MNRSGCEIPAGRDVRAALIEEFLDLNTHSAQRTCRLPGRKSRISVSGKQLTGADGQIPDRLQGGVVRRQCGARRGQQLAWRHAEDLSQGDELVNVSMALKLHHARESQWRYVSADLIQVG